MSRPSLELFHRIADSESAAIRRLVTELEITDEVDFRNIDISESAAKDLRRHGGARVPALWTGDELIEGREEIEDYLHDATTELFPELLENFDRLVDDVWLELQAQIPDEFANLISRIHFIIEDEPSPELLADLSPDLAERPWELCGLHVGTPITQDLVTIPSSEPVRVYLFRWALMDQIADDDPDPESTLREEIAVTLLHEIGHYFGLEEDDLERLGYD